MIDIIVIMICTFVIICLICLIQGNDSINMEANKEAKEIIVKHLAELRIKRLQKRKLDSYGNIVDHKWIKEMDYFYETVLFPSLSQKYGVISQYSNNKKIVPGIKYISKVIFYDLLNKEIDKYSDGSPMSSVDINTLSPVAFESFCSGVLIENGWSSTTTKGSGDQGIDIIATINGKKAVFQCKKLSSPVGNKAVQEIIAGRSYVSADYAFVVSNAEYTSAAKELAAKSGVLLLHYSSLAKLGKTVR